MNIGSLEDIQITKLRKIPTLGGDVMHGLKNSESQFNDFGELYFSFVEKDAIKAWKYHKRMTLNLIVPIGEIKLVFHSTNRKNFFRTEIIGEKRYVRVTVPPRIWFGFKGISSSMSLMANIADIEHSPDEVKHKNLSSFNYNWSSE